MSQKKPSWSHKNTANCREWSRINTNEILLREANSNPSARRRAHILRRRLRQHRCSAAFRWNKSWWFCCLGFCWRRRGPKSRENIRNEFHERSRHFVRSVVIYVKKRGWIWSPESHHYSNKNTLHWHFRLFFPFWCVSSVVFNMLCRCFAVLALPPLLQCPVFHLRLTSRAKTQECAKVWVHSNGDIYTVTAL